MIGQITCQSNSLRRVTLFATSIQTASSSLWLGRCLSLIRWSWLWVIRSWTSGSSSWAHATPWSSRRLWAAAGVMERAEPAVGGAAVARPIRRSRRSRWRASWSRATRPRSDWTQTLGARSHPAGTDDDGEGAGGRRREVCASVWLAAREASRLRPDSVLA